MSDFLFFFGKINLQYVQDIIILNVLRSRIGCRLLKKSPLDNMSARKNICQKICLPDKVVGFS